MQPMNAIAVTHRCFMFGFYTLQCAMTPIWAASLLANTLCFAYLLKRCSHRSIFACQAFSFAASFLLLFLYYYTGCSQRNYEHAYFAAELCCSILELWVLYRLVLNQLNFAGIAVCAAIVAHQSCKLQWFWASLPFHSQTETELILTYAWAATNLIVMIAFCLMAYDASMNKPAEPTPTTPPPVHPKPNDIVGQPTKPEPPPPPPQKPA